MRMFQPVGSAAWPFCILVFGIIGLVPPLALADDLPPPPRSTADLNQLFKLYLDLVINDYPTTQIVPVIVRGDDFFIEKKIFQSLGIKLALPAASAASATLTADDLVVLGFANSPDDWLHLQAVPEIQSHYISSRQVLALQLPAAWMPTQMLGQDSWFQAQQAQSSTGFLNNYTVYITRPDDSQLSTSIFLEQRLFSAFGVFKNSGNYLHSRQQDERSDRSSSAQQGYIRFDSTWQYDHQPSATAIVIGDIMTASKSSWGTAVRLGGIQIKRDFGTRPDLITYPLPQFSGQVAVPSTVDLLINGQKTQSSAVQSGPFIINNIPFVTGRGEAVIVTTNAVGRQVTTTIPFYVASNLLKKHLVDYAFSSGKLRQDFGIKNFSYAQWATSLDARYGLQDWWTLEAKAEYADAVQLAGLGSVFRLWNFGTVNAAYAQSKQLQHGHQYTFGYSYNQNRFGFSINHSQRDAQFRDLASLASSDLVSVYSQKFSTAQSYFALPKAGTFGLSYLQTQAKTSANKILNISWSPILPRSLRGATLSLSASRDLLKQDWGAALQFSLPLFHNAASFNAGYSRDANRQASYVNYTQSSASDGGFGYDLSHRFTEDHAGTSQARINYFNRYFNSDFGMTTQAEQNSYWLGLSGSMLLMKQGLFLSNRLGDSFALIDTHHVADVPVRYENTLLGRTNRNGYMIVPSVSPYYMAKYSIDPLGLASTYNASRTEQRVAAKRGTGIVVDFPIKHSSAATVYFVDEQQQALPVGSVVHRSAQASSYIGMDGMAYLEDLQTQNQVLIQLPNAQRCQANFAIDRALAEKQIVSLTHIICHEVKE
jgi:outer membrane usher protein